MKKLLLALLVVMVAPSAFGAEAFELCDDTNWTAVDGTDATAATGSVTNYIVRRGECRVYRFTTTEDSDLIHLPQGGLFVFRPSIDGSDAAEIAIRMCVGGNLTVSANTCHAISTPDGSGTTFTGAAGKDARYVPPGSYYIDNVTSASGDTATVTIYGGL